MQMFSYTLYTILFFVMCDGICVQSHGEKTSRTSRVAAMLNGVSPEGLVWFTREACGRVWVNACNCRNSWSVRSAAEQQSQTVG